MQNIISWEVWSKSPETGLGFITRSYVFSIILITAMITIAFGTYWIMLKKIKPHQKPNTYIVLIQLYIGYIRSLVVELLGKKAEKLTPYFLYLFSYILLSNTVGIFGFKNPTATFLVPLMMGFVTWIGIFAFGFKYQRLSYLKSFCFNVKINNKKIPVMINPIEVFSSAAPLISISFRLWGNIFAGEIIATLLFAFTKFVLQSVPFLNQFNLLGAITIWPLNIYFDLLCGLIQTVVFVMLTIVYWSLAKGEQEEVVTNTY